MRILNGLCAVYWAAMLIAFILGYFTPNKVDIGCAFFLATMCFVNNATE